MGRLGRDKGVEIVIRIYCMKLTLFPIKTDKQNKEICGKDVQHIYTSWKC